MAWVNLLQAVYPVGSIYLSTVSTSPASLVGGTWSQITSAVLRGSTSVGYIGADTHTVTVDEMPTHHHNINDYITNDSTAQGYWNLVWNNHSKQNGSITTSETGGGQAMSLVQRSYNCYIWYRTA